MVLWDGSASPCNHDRHSLHELANVSRSRVLAHHVSLASCHGFDLMRRHTVLVLENPWTRMACSTLSAPTHGKSNIADVGSRSRSKAAYSNRSSIRRLTLAAYCTRISGNGYSARWHAHWRLRASSSLQVGCFIQDTFPGLSRSLGWPPQDCHHVQR